jgi:hypothetical protein
VSACIQHDNGKKGVKRKKLSATLMKAKTKIHKKIPKFSSLWNIPAAILET